MNETEEREGGRENQRKIKIEKRKKKIHRTGEKVRKRDK